eukprot:5087024-Amphidinium_carterae.1
MKPKFRLGQWKPGRNERERETKAFENGSQTPNEGDSATASPEEIRRAGKDFANANSCTQPISKTPELKYCDTTGISMSTTLSSEQKFASQVTRLLTEGGLNFSKPSPKESQTSRNIPQLAKAAKPLHTG